MTIGADSISDYEKYTIRYYNFDRVCGNNLIWFCSGYYAAGTGSMDGQQLVGILYSNRTLRPGNIRYL